MNELELWQDADKDVLGEKIWQRVRSLSDYQRDIHERHFRCAWLYNNQPINEDYSYMNAGMDTTPVTENVVESVVDTATSMIGKNRPRASFMTDGALWDAQRRAHKMGLFIEAEFHRLMVYEKGASTFRDGCVFGTGGVKISRVRGTSKMQVERVLADEIVVDESECRTGSPRELHHVKFVDRGTLKALHAKGPKKKAIEELIDNANAAQPGQVFRWTSWRRVEKTQCVVVESWHLPSAEGADDGRHVISLDSGVLLDESWTKDFFPFVFYRWSERLTGFYGRGLAEQLAGIQLRINKLNRFISRAQDLIAVPRIFVGPEDQHIKAKMNNQIGMICVTRSGQAPHFSTPPAVSPEIYQYKEQLKASAYQFAGISELSAQSKKPADLESGAALREFNDIETGRFAIQAQRLESWYLEVARQLVIGYKEIAAAGGKPAAMWKARRRFQAIDWQNVDLEEDVYSMTIEASSILSRTPAGRLQAVIEMTQSGLIDQDEARRLMQHPDLERSMSLYNAALDDAEAVIADLIDGKWSAPEPFENLAMCIHRVQLGYLQARGDGAPEDILADFRDWVNLAINMLKPGSQASDPAPPPTMPANAPVGAPPPGQLPVPLPAAPATPQPGPSAMPMAA